jgi:threonine dehydratase
MYPKIQEAFNRIYNIVHKTPVFSSKTLNLHTGCEIYLKCENFQRMGAFKFRGAVNAVMKLSDEQRKRGIITHSSGNHAQAIALAGKLFQIPTTIVMPENAPEVKIEATKGYGADIVFCGASVVSREKATLHQIDKYNYTFIHPYDNLDVIEGAGTVAIEIIDELGGFDAIIAPVGGGGLISGTSIVAKESKKIKFVFGAEPKNADDAYQSLKQGKIIPQTNPNTIADGLRTQLSELTFSFIQKYVDDIITVTEQEIIEAMRILFERMKLVVEPSGAVSLAVAMKLSKEKQFSQGSRVVCIISGGNIDLSEFFSLLEKKIR